jgi:hypothetical protein
MHSLVQLATKKGFELHGQTGSWQRVSMEIMAAAFPNGQPNMWTACRTLLPHWTKVLSYDMGGETRSGEGCDQHSMISDADRRVCEGGADGAKCSGGDRGGACLRAL